MPAKIVVADDSRTQRSTISLALERSGHKVIQAGSGLEAITQVCREDPDLLVSDIIMPDLNGYQVCRLLKNDPAIQDIPIILLTTLDQQEHRFWGKEAGADSYVLKAADSAPLEKEVARLLVEKKRPPVEERQGKGLPILARQGAQAVLSDLLDHLLFEATIANRIREIGRFSGNLERSVQAFFEFFQDLIDYQITILCMHRSAAPLLVVHLKETVPASLLEIAKETLKKNRFLNPGDMKNAKVHILNPESLDQDMTCKADRTPGMLFVPFSADLEDGGLAVLSLKNDLYPEETANICKIAVRELEPILKLNLQAEAMEEMKADFTAMIVHDLRSPLMAVLSGAAVLEDGLVGPVNEEQLKWLRKVQAGTRSLLNLVDDFLDLSRLEAGHIDLSKENVDLDQLIRNSLDNYIVLAQDKKISLESRVSPTLPSVSADPRRLDQVFANLLSNAIKFTPQGGKIEVGTDQENGAGARIWVKDSGVGIPGNEIGQLFEKYRQTTSGKTSKYKGTGLGLVICKMIVEAHGGKIWVESEEGKGTTFFLTLPL
jgi:signal transduction histidine kinase